MKSNAIAAIETLIEYIGQDKCKLYFILENSCKRKLSFQYEDVILYWLLLLYANISRIPNPHDM